MADSSLRTPVAVSILVYGENTPQGKELNRILKAIKKEDKAFSELIINSEPLEKRVAQLKNGVLEKFEVERAGDARRRDSACR